MAPRRTALQLKASDPSYLHMSKLADTCVLGINACNFLDRVNAYNRGVLLHFKKGGVELIARMQMSKALCDLILQKHAVVDRHVRRAVSASAVEPEEAEEALYLVDQISECIPPNSKARVAPYAIRRMHELREEWRAIIQKDRDAHKCELELEGGSLVEWDSDIA